MSDIDTAQVDSLKALDLERPIREANIVKSISRMSALCSTSITLILLGLVSLPDLALHLDTQALVSPKSEYDENGRHE